VEREDLVEQGEPFAGHALPALPQELEELLFLPGV
jgi:hypothetical protein